MKRYPIYLAGEFRFTNDIRNVTNPWNDEILAEVCMAGPNELEEALQKAESAKKSLAALPAYKRSHILSKLSEQLLQRVDEFAQKLSLESAKPIRYATAEILRSADTFRIASEEALRLPAEYFRLDRTESARQREALVRYVPAGIVAGISPFNFPLNLAVHKIAPAIASGCPIILKPAGKTPLSCLLLSEILSQTDLPPGAVSILPASRETGDILVQDSRPSVLSFTGSPDVGWNMKSRAGRKKIVLELGGNAGVIICSSANYNSTLERSLYGAFAYSGQICIHAQRFFVHESLYPSFCSDMKKRAESLNYGNPIHPETEISVVIDENAAIQMEKRIHDALEKGATLLCGGKRTKNYLEPTILLNATKGMEVYDEEIFGPVITIESFQTIEEAVEKLNNSHFGLQAGIFTTNINECDYAFATIEAGGIILNDVPTWRSDMMPYGGVKDSGLGREGVRYAMMDMLESRVLVKTF